MATTRNFHFQLFWQLKKIWNLEILNCKFNVKRARSCAWGLPAIPLYLENGQLILRRSGQLQHPSLYNNNNNNNFYSNPNPNRLIEYKIKHVTSNECWRETSSQLQELLTVPPTKANLYVYLNHSIPNFKLLQDFLW